MVASLVEKLQRQSLQNTLNGEEIRTSCKEIVSRLDGNIINTAKREQLRIIENAIQSIPLTSVENILLVDSFRRIIVASKLHQLVNDFKSWESANFQQTQKPPIAAEFFRILGITSPSLQQGENEYLALLRILTGNREVSIADVIFDPKKLGTDQLLDAKDPALIVFRLGQTDYFENSIYPLAVSYAKKKEGLDSLSVISTDEYKKMLGSELNLYSGYFMGYVTIPRFALRSAVEMFKAPLSKQDFLIPVME